MSRRADKNGFGKVALLLVGGLLAFSGRGDLNAQQKDAPQEDAAGVQRKTPLATFLTVASPVDDSVHTRVRTAALALAHEAQQENRRAFLILEISPGSSQFHHVQGLARFLTSPELANVTTIAWIPKTVTGNNAILALACNDIVMDPAAELGDIGKGEAVEPADQNSVLSLVDRRHNMRVNAAIAKAMMDPQIAVRKIQIEVGPPDNRTVESRVVTEEELRQLQNEMAVIREARPIKEAGAVGLFRGETARRLDILIRHTATSRRSIPDLYNLPPGSMREAQIETPQVQLIKVEGEIQPLMEAFVIRQIERSVAAGANLIIFEIDSPGGHLGPSLNLANTILDLESKNVRTVAYVPKMALSGAAMISLGCDDIYMHPDAQIGDAGPIELREGGQFHHVDAKMLSPIRESLKSLAEKKGRPPAIAEAMADKDLLVYQVTHRETGRTWYMTEHELHAANEDWIKGQVVPESRKNNLLTVNGRRAAELQLARPPVEDLEELKLRLELPPQTDLTAAAQTWVDTLVFILNSDGMTFLMFVAGAACIYLELYTMTGFFGIISALCFSLFFWSRFLGGTAGWLEVVLFLLGLTLIMLEIFVIPGFGVFGVSGGLMVIASIILASQTFSSLEPSRAIEDMTGTLGTFGASILTVIVLAIALSRYLPQMPILRHMVLAPPGAELDENPDEPRLRPEFSASSSSSGMFGQNQDLLGMQGTAASMLRPAGKAQIDGRFLDVVSDGSYIQQGSKIEVISASGNRIVVKQV
jgi:membrane-bound serine protease (ClpP class)